MAVLGVEHVLEVPQFEAPLPAVDVELDVGVEGGPGVVRGHPGRQLTPCPRPVHCKENSHCIGEDIMDNGKTVNISFTLSRLVLISALVTTSFLTFLHVEGSVSLLGRPEPGAGGGQGLGHPHCPVVPLAGFLVHEAPVLALVAVHVLPVHLGHQVVLAPLGPRGQALELLHGAFGARHVDACLEVELEPVIVGARVQIGLGVSALVEAGAALGVAEQEGAFEGALDRLRLPPEHRVHRSVARDVGTKSLKCVKICLTIT